MYIPFDPEAPENQQMVNSVFVMQSYTNICQKLQKLEGFADMNATQLIEVTNKVLASRDHEAKREADKRLKTKSLLRTAALGKLDPTGQSAPP